jgi:hypothetical protein
MKWKEENSDDRVGSRRDDLVTLQNEIRMVNELTKAYESKYDRYQNLPEEVKDEIKVFVEFDLRYLTFLSQSRPSREHEFSLRYNTSNCNSAASDSSEL